MLTGDITYSRIYYRQYRQRRGGLIVKQNVSNSAQCSEMNFLTIFQPHLRLIYVFLCGLIVSTMTHISTLVILNLVVLSGLFTCANTLSKIPCRLF